MLNLQTTDDNSSRSAPLVFEACGVLDENDLVLLASSDRDTSSPLKRIRSRHHALARSLARGMRPGVAASYYGYSASRISVLQADPTFQELVAHYKDSDDVDYSKMDERLLGISVDALDELNDRLESKPDSIPTAQLMKLVELGADRMGYSPKTTTEVNVNVGFAERLRAARQRVTENTNVIDGEAKRLPPAAE